MNLEKDANIIFIGHECPETNLLTKNLKNIGRDVMFFSYDSDTFPESVLFQLSKGGEYIVFLVAQSISQNSNIRVPAKAIVNLNVVLNCIPRIASEDKFGAIVLDKIERPPLSEDFVDVVGQPNFLSDRDRELYFSINSGMYFTRHVTVIDDIPNNCTELLDCILAVPPISVEPATLDLKILPQNIEKQIYFFESGRDTFQKLTETVCRQSLKRTELFLKNSNGDVAKAIDNIIFSVCASTGTSGFLSSCFGTFQTLALAFPDLAFSTYMNLSMCAMIAKLRGYDIGDLLVQQMLKAALLGSALADIAKEAGAKFVLAGARSPALQKVTVETTIKISRLLGLKFSSLSATKGAGSFLKFIPLVGGIVGMGMNITETKVISKFAMNQFPSLNSDIIRSQLIEKTEISE